MRVKAYVVLRACEDGSEEIVAIRLTMGAAQAIQQRTPSSRIERWQASKEPTLQPVERVALAEAS